MDEQIQQSLRRERRRRESEQENKKADSSSAVTVTQIVLCVILTIVIFLTAKSDSEASRRLKTDFQRLMSWSIENSDAKNVVKTVKEYLSSPFEFLPAFSPITPPETADYESSTAEPDVTEPEESTENTTEPETTVEETTSKKAEPETMKKISSSGSSDSGGKDISYKAEEKTSFAPVATTAPIVAPVSSTRYTSNFGYRTNPITNERSFHTGLDIAAPLGTKIRAAYSGTVRKTGEDSHSGKYIFVTHDDGFETFYCHCSEILAEQGAVIRQGETIALVGSTGWSTGPHLHFEIRKDGIRLDPQGVLEGKTGDS